MLTINREFIDSEMIAEAHINHVASAKDLLKQGKVNECLGLLEKLEHTMQITLAIGELYDEITIQ